MMNEEIAKTILTQFGGRKFIVMTGAKDFGWSETTGNFTFKIGRNSANVNTIKVSLRSDDTYNLSFEKISVSKKTFDVKEKIIKKFEGVYCDMLAPLFTEVTGMYTKLF